MTALLVGMRAARRGLCARDGCARGRRRGASAASLRRALGSALALALLSGLGASGLRAQGVAGEEMRSLDEQVQEIKSDVLGIAAELGDLEEKLLYPSGTQVAVFVSLAEGERFRLDSVQIQIDGELVAHYIYSFKELEALQKGGVQRIYTGNIPNGEHRLDVAFAGVLPGGGDLSRSQSFRFDKGVGPELVGITLRGSGDPGIQLGGW